MNYLTLNDIHITHITGNILAVSKGTELDSDQLMPESVQLHLDIGNLQEVKTTPANATTTTPIPTTENSNPVVKASDKAKV
jgi:hypothetical protein